MVRAVAVLMLVLTACAPPTTQTPAVPKPKADADASSRPAQDEVILRLTRGYQSAKDARDYKRAYAFMSPSFKASLPFATFTANADRFNAAAGKVRERRVVKVTWLRSPPTPAPLPGIYAAVDFVGKFANIDRYCGYIVFYQQPSGAFLLVREEENYMTRQTEGTSSPQEAERMWAQLSKFCP
jgi:uncharacterized protein DUF4019